MKKRIYSFVLICIISTFALGGNTGKIGGIVLDKNNGNPLAGVNVMLKDTYLGAATDLNGEYYILNIPPGSYQVECAYVGYQTFIMNQVLVQSDQTTILNFDLTEQTMELDEAIVVTADRPLVQKDLTSSKRVTTTEEIKALPVETYAGIMLTQAGINQGADGAIHIRGGRSTEIAYLVDGISVANPFSTNGIANSVATNAIQEMTVVSGAFNAEYGNAMSGIVNFTTKDGSPEFKTFLSFYTGDYLSSHDNIFVNIDDINPFANHNYEGTLSGPLSFLGISGQNNTFFLSARYNKSEGYLYGIREHLTTDSSNFELKKYETKYKDEAEEITITEYRDEWYIEMNGDNAFVPMNPSDGLNLLGKFKFQISPELTMRFQSLYENSWRKSYAHAYKYNPDGIYQYFTDSYNNSLQLTHTISNSTYYEFKLALNHRNYKKYTFEDYTNPKYASTDRIQGDPQGTTFNFGGAQRDHIYEKSNTYLGKMDFTSQIDKNNLVKSGFEARLNVLDREFFTMAYNRNEFPEPTRANWDYYIRYPRQFSAYFQDKLEYKDMILNAGLRYDYFYSDSPYALDELQPDGERAQSDEKQMVSPRLGISFPITETGIIHLSYGHFYQMPALSNLYSNSFFFLPVNNTSPPEFGNSNLEPEKQITYEIGAKQQFGDMMALDVTGFYKDIRNLLAWQEITFRTIEGDRTSYRVRRNQDYANVMGITTSLEKRAFPSNPIGAKIDYTFQLTEGNDNDPSSFYYNSLSGEENVKKSVPLDWDQSHNLSASVTYAPEFGLVISMIARFSSGYPYTAEVFESNYDSEPNSSRKPFYSNVDLKASYRFQLMNTWLQVFAKVYNLFDTLNERYVFDDTGSAAYTFATRSVDEPASFRNHYGEPGVHTYDEYNVRPGYYRSPRSIRLGISVEY